MVNTIKGPLKPNTEIQVISKNLIALAARNIKNVLESVDYLETVNNCLHIENTKCCFVMAYSSTHLPTARPVHWFNSIHVFLLQ